MVRFGFPLGIVEAWMVMLFQLPRTVLVDGGVYGNAGAVTGIPEGDPLSVVGMFVFAKAFDHFVQCGPAKALCFPLTLTINFSGLSRLLTVERFLDLCNLLVAPSKCWFWAICPSGRRRLRAASLLGQKVPVKLQARELGADISYCLKKAAKVRNGRATTGLNRMTKLDGI